jgi:hypothetical protein
MIAPRGIVTLLCFAAIWSGCGFARVESSWSPDPPGFFIGIWHGLLAPYTLVIRFFLDVHMYALPNSGWFYDLGFLLGVAGCIPIGWLAALIQIGFIMLS